MKRISIIVVGALVGCMLVTNAWAQEMASGDFDKLKKLEGEWKGVKPDGKTVEVSYEIMSGGAAVVETLESEGEPSMVTVYHLNGDKLMMTHYCSAGNQPRMEAASVKDGNLDFKLVDITNMKEQSEGHMRGLKIVFVDDNHFNQVWNWSKEEEIPSTFKYERVI